MIKLELFTGDLKYRRRWEEPPIKLTPPYSETSAAEQLSSHQYAVMQLCNVEVHEEVFIGLLGGHECADYVVSSTAFSDGHIEDGRDEVVPGIATGGSYTGASFAAYDFSAHNEDLVISVDGQDQTAALTVNIAHETAAVTALSAALTGVVVTALDSGNIHIASRTTGASSVVTINSRRSGTHAVALFGTGAAVGGSNGATVYDAAPATSGSYAGYHFHAHNFVGQVEDLVISVDGVDQTIVLATHVVDVDCALDALVGLAGAHASIHEGQIKVTSESTGAHSTVYVSQASGTHAQALFYDVCEEFVGSHADVSRGAVTPLLDGHSTFDSCKPGGLNTYSFAVTAAMADSGFQVTLEDLTGDSNPRALGLYVYAGEVADDLDTELKSEFSTSGTYSCQISPHDLKECVYHVIVRCTANLPSQYRILPKLTPAYIGSHGIQGYLCGGGWAYHYATTASFVHGGGSGGHGRRQLSGASGIHARFHVLLHTGDAYCEFQHLCKSQHFVSWNVCL